MSKKSYLIISLLTLLNGFQAQGTPEDNITGPLLFGASIIGTIGVQRWNQSNKKPVEEPKKVDINAKPAIQSPVRPTNPQTSNSEANTDDSAQAIKIQKIARGWKARKDYNQKIGEENERKLENERLKQEFPNRQANRQHQQVLTTTQAQNQPILLLKNEPEYQSDEYNQAILNNTMVRRALISTQNHPRSQQPNLSIPKELSPQKNPRNGQLRLMYTPEWHDQQKAKEDKIRTKAYETKKKETLDQIKAFYKSQDIKGIEALLSSNIRPFTDSRSQDKALFNSSSYPNSKISTRYTFQPKDLPLTKKVIFLEVIHGTWAKPESFGEDTNKDLSQSFIFYAQQLAIEKDAIVYLDVVDWTGKIDRTNPSHLVEKLTRKTRIDAGMALGKELSVDIKKIKESNKDAEVSIQLFTHSHGANVGNAAAEELKKDGIIIDKAVFFAAPALDVEISNIKHVINAFGNFDFIGRMGTFLSTCGTKYSVRKQSSSETSSVTNVVVKIDGQDLNHKNIKHVGMRYLPLIERYLQDNFKGEEHLIIDIYDTQKSGNEKAQEDEDGYEEVKTNTHKPNYEITGAMDERRTDGAYDFEALEDPKSNFYKSYHNAQEFKKRYGYSIDAEADLMEQVIDEATSANVPSWVLKTLIEAQKQSRNIVDSRNSFNDYLQNLWTYITRPVSPEGKFPSESSPKNSSESIDQKIKNAQQGIAAEPSYKKKSLIVAQLYATALEYDEPEKQMQFLEKISSDLQEENRKITSWQYSYEWIIGKTRTTDNPEWAEQEFDLSDLYKAKEIYNRISSNQGEDWNSMLSGFEHLDDYTQQALVSAIEQGLKSKNIEDIANNYLKKLKTTSGECSPSSESKSETRDRSFWTEEKLETLLPKEIPSESVSDPKDLNR